MQFKQQTCVNKGYTIYSCLKTAIRGHTIQTTDVCKLGLYIYTKATLTKKALTFKQRQLWLQRFVQFKRWHLFLEGIFKFKKHTFVREAIVFNIKY